VQHLALEKKKRDICAQAEHWPSAILVSCACGSLGKTCELGFWFALPVSILVRTMSVSHFWCQKSWTVERMWLVSCVFFFQWSNIWCSVAYSYIQIN